MKIPTLLAVVLTAVTTQVGAEDNAQSCVMGYFSSGEGAMTLADVRKACPTAEQELSIAKNEVEAAISKRGSISNRFINEKKTEFNQYVLTPHKLNYLLPAITTNRINKEAYRSLNGYEENLEHIESKFQLSLKVPLNNDSLLIEGDALYIGFTLQAWWQIYADGISKPFRETNYQPEVFYLAPLDWQPFAGNTGFIVGLEHQSNGRGQGLSRSWNRFYTHFLFEKDNFALSLKPWLRLSEEKKTFALDPEGDDNRDIEDFMGNFELGLVYKWNELELSFKGRQNFDTHYGAAEVGLTFPLWGRLRGYATGFNGYGESLIDYNYSQTRFGIGISLNNVL